jgi:hypothetical protein
VGNQVGGQIEVELGDTHQVSVRKKGPDTPWNVRANTCDRERERAR